MRRKICTIGNSQGVSPPADVLEKLHLAVGADVEVSLDEENGRIVLGAPRAWLKGQPLTHRHRRIASFYSNHHTLFPAVPDRRSRRRMDE